MKRYEATLKDLIKIQSIFKDNIEFESKEQILRKIGTVKESVLDEILKYLKSNNKIIENHDKSWTWIYAADNEKLKKSFSRAVKL